MVPLLSQIPLDMSFFKKETTSTSVWLQDTSEKMETEGGDGSKENQDQLLPDPSSEPPAVFIYMIDPLSNCVDNMALERLFSRSGASATSSATSASPTPSASPSTSRPSPLTPSTLWRVRTKQYIIEPSTNLRLVSYWPFPSSCLKCLRHFYN